MLATSMRILPREFDGSALSMCNSPVNERKEPRTLVTMAWRAMKPSRECTISTV